MDRDYILEIVFDTGNVALEESIQAQLFVSACTGSTSVETGPETIISAYFDSLEEREEAARLLVDLNVEVREIERERVDWLDLYQQSLEPLVIGERFIVAPDAALIPAGTERFTIIVPQELAFGTGSHETTSLCIQLLEELKPAATEDVALADAYETVEVSLANATSGAKWRGLDIGSGSGILAIAMLRLGAVTAIAFDNDLDAYGPLRDNRIRNGVSEDAMPMFIGGVEALRGGTFDVVTMNIIPEVILPLLPDVVGHVEPDGLLILSGILVVRRDDVVAACEALGFTVRAEKTRGEWWAGALVRR